MQLRRRTAEEPVTLAVCAWLASRPSSSRNLFLWESVSSNLTACDVGRADPSLRPQCRVQPAEGQWRDFGWSNRKESSCHRLATPASEPRVFQGLLHGEGLPKGGQGGRTRGKKRLLPGVLTPALGLLWPHVTDKGTVVREEGTCPRSPRRVSTMAPPTLLHRP